MITRFKAVFFALMMGSVLCAQYTIQKIDIVRISTPITIDVSTVSINVIVGSTFNVTGSTISVIQPIDVSGSLVDVTGSVISDSRYYAKISTGSSGMINTSGNIIINYAVKDFSFYSVGGDVAITGNRFDGTIYALDGIPIGQEFNISLSSPVIFQCTIPASTNLYYMVSGEK